MDLTLDGLQEAFKADLTPSALIKRLYPSYEKIYAAFIHLVPLEKLLERCQELEAQSEDARGRLWGVPFAVKDNVDVEGCPTTAACPAFSYPPKATAPAVARLLEEGGVMVGKTNMDQFASGLVGTRSPYGCPHNVFDHRFIPGGSSSGSGVLVGGNLVTFAIGTDTAGSGRVPAGYNACVGIKPTLGRLSTLGVVPACASLDCLSIFAQNTKDGIHIMNLMQEFDGMSADAWRRPMIPHSSSGSDFTFGVPSAQFLDFDGPGGSEYARQSRKLFEAAIEAIKSCGGIQNSIDFQPLADVAEMLYQSSFVAERYSGIHKFLNKTDPREPPPTMAVSQASTQQLSLVDDQRLLPVTRKIISLAGNFTAIDVYNHLAELAALKAQAHMLFRNAKILVVPTVLEHYTQAELRAEEEASPPIWSKNRKNGCFTNFANLLDLCGISIPAGFIKYDMASEEALQGASESVRNRCKHLKETGTTEICLPFGITLLCRAWHDDWLGTIAGKVHAKYGGNCGPHGHGITPQVA